MLPLILRRLGMMVLIMLVSSFILYLMFEFDKDRVVIQAIGPYTNSEQRARLARPEWLQRTVPVALRLLGRQGADRRFRHFHPVQQAGDGNPPAEPRQHRHPGSVGLYPDRRHLARSRRAVRHRRGQPRRPLHLGVLGAHHLGAGIRLRNLPASPSSSTGSTGCRARRPAPPSSSARSSSFRWPSSSSSISATTRA